MEHNTKEYVDSLVTQLLALTPTLKQYFFTKLWERMDDYDLYLIQANLDPLNNKNETKDDESISSDKVKGIIQKRSRFDILGQLMHQPSISENIINKLDLDSLMKCLKVNKRWNLNLLNDGICFNLLKSYYNDSSNKIITYYPDNLWKSSFLYHYKMLKMLTKQVQVDNRLSLTVENINFAKDTVLFIDYKVPFLVVVVKKEHGVEILIFKSDLSIFNMHIKYSCFPFNIPLDCFRPSLKIPLQLMPSCLDIYIMNNELKLIIGFYLRYQTPHVITIDTTNFKFKIDKEININSTNFSFSILSIKYFSLDDINYCVLGNSNGEVILLNSLGKIKNIVLDNNRSSVIKVDIIDQKYILVVTNRGLINIYKIINTEELDLQLLSSKNVMSDANQREEIIIHKVQYFNNNLVLNSYFLLIYVLLIPNKEFEIVKIFQKLLRSSISNLSFIKQPISRYNYKTQKLNQIINTNFNNDPNELLVYPLLLGTNLYKMPPMYIFYLENKENQLIYNLVEVQRSLAKSNKTTCLSALSSDLLIVATRSGCLWLMKIK